MNPKPRSPQRPGLISSIILTPGHLPLVNSTPARLDLMWNYAVASAFKSRRLHPSAPTTQSEPPSSPRGGLSFCGKSANAALFSSSTLMPIWHQAQLNLTRSPPLHQTRVDFGRHPFSWSSGCVKPPSRCARGRNDARIDADNETDSARMAGSTERL